MRRLLSLLLAISFLSYGAEPNAPKQKEVKVHKSSVSKEQEIQLGKQAAAEVEREMEGSAQPGTPDTEDLGRAFRSWDSKGDS